VSDASDSFFLAGTASDPWYERIRDKVDNMERVAREFIESLWREYATYAPPDFRAAARNDLFAHFWEMYVACTLLRRNKALVPRHTAASGAPGPDLQIARTPPIWVEAVAPTLGTGPDAVPPLPPGNLAEVAESEIMLRYVQSIVSKRDAHERYVEDSVIGAADPYVVAVGAGRFLRAIIESQLASIMRSTLGFGPLHPVRLPDGSTVYSFDAPLAKQSGSNVVTDLLLRPEFAGVSAVVWSPANPYHSPGELGSEFIWVFNPSARNPLKPECFRFGRAYWLEGSSLRIQDWGAK